MLGAASLPQAPRNPDYYQPEKGEPMRRAVYEFLKAGGVIPRAVHRPTI